MRKVKVTLALLCLLKALSLGQGEQRPSAKLIRSPFSGGNFIDVVQEAASEIKANADGPEDMAAIRVCSAEPMPVALIIAAANPFAVAEYLEYYGFTPERILFLRAENCPKVVKGIAVTEFWAIPKGAVPPLSVESVKASQARADVVKANGTINSAEAFNDALLKLSSKLRANRGTTGVIVGFYIGKPPHMLKMSMRKAARFLKKSNIKQQQYFSRLQRLTGPYAELPSNSQPKYPDLFVIELQKIQ
jgi:hypothetical protein